MMAPFGIKHARSTALPQEAVVETNPKPAVSPIFDTTEVVEETEGYAPRVCAEAAGGPCDRV